MSNILKVTTPVAGYDNTNGVKINQENLPQNSNIQGQVKPDKVVRPDARSDAAAQQSEAALKFRYETNFDNFIQQMAKTTNITEEFSSALLEKLGILAQSGLKEGLAGEISKFLSMISMSPQEMAAFLKTQGQSAVRFNGAFFEVLRQIMQQSSSVDLRAGILDFLKRYTDMAEGKHLLMTMRQLMQDIKAGMLKNPGDQLEQMNQQMNYEGAVNGNVKENANLLKNQILPFLNEYISKMHERGSLRENAAMLAALTARYENGDAGRLQEAFLRLMDFQMFAKRFKNLDPATLMKVLANSEFENASLRNDAMGHFAEIIRRGVMGEAGTENKMVFKELMQAFLLNESVYMPVLHLTLPLNINGTLMFSELWIDPDDEGAAESGEERVIKGLIKFDIKNVGFFDLFFLYGADSGKVSIQLNYPKTLQASEGEVRDSLGKILADNGLKQEELILGTEEGSIPITAAFPNILKGRTRLMSQFNDLMNKKAVALSYDEDKSAAPVIVASGSGYMAEKIIETARESGVPVYEDNSLATVLTQLDLGSEIPEQLYQAIVDIYVYFLKFSGESASPQKKTEPEIQQEAESEEILNQPADLKKEEPT